jgi:HK97 family phage prohead protease
MPKTVSLEEFRRDARQGNASKDAHLRASFATQVKVGDGNDRTLTITISTANVDRMGDTINPAGWKLDNFLRNPTVLWAHDTSMLPVAKANQVWVAGDKLKAIAEFTPADMSRFNDTVFQMYKKGFLSATSVGFHPLKYAFSDDPQRRSGIDFLEQELVEFSCVPVPANADALIEARSAGVNIGPVLQWAEKIINLNAHGQPDTLARRVAVLKRKLEIEAIVRRGGKL